MGSFNRGEWSEIYAIVSLLLHPELSIGNAELEELTNSLYNLKKIKINDPNSVGIIEYAVNNTDDVEVFYDDMLKNLISRVELEESKKVIFDGINNAPIGS